MAQLSGPTKDAWQNFGFVYGRSGAARGTTTSSGVLLVNTGFTRQVVFAIGYDEATALRNTQTGGGPSQTKGSFYDFQPLTPNGAQARYRVRKNLLSAGGTQSSMTLASTTTGVTVRWLAFGF